MSDVRRMGEWSPECRRMVAWGGLREGAWVLGVNRRGPMVWPTNSRITRCEPPTAIAWRVLENGTEWSYQVGTDSGTGGATIEHDEELTSALQDLSARRESARFADLTAFEWDTVHGFSEGATSQRVQAAVGAEVLAGDRYLDPGNLLVFLDQRAVVRAVSVIPDLLVMRSVDVRRQRTGALHPWKRRVRRLVSFV